MDGWRGSVAETVVRGGTVLVPGEGLRPADVVCADGMIIDIVSKASTAGCRIVDATGCLVLPGIVDIHGDAFERQIMPRPKTLFPLDVAMLETDRQLAANGITTAFHGITVSWEPGLRGLAQSKATIAALDTLETQLLIDNRIHLRWETFAVDEVPAIVSFFLRDKPPALAFNDHTTSSLASPIRDDKLHQWADRAMIEPDAYHRLLLQQEERKDEVQTAIEVLASVARNHGVPMLSHDDKTPEGRDYYREIGVAVAEFPVNWETAGAAAQHGDAIVMGSPNVLRGGSHIGAIAAEEAVRRQQCTILASDYFYPALLQGALALTERKTLPLEQAWDLVSAAPAKAMNLDDRGVLAPGKRADVIVIPLTRSRPRATLSNGRMVYCEA